MLVTVTCRPRPPIARGGHAGPAAPHAPPCRRALLRHRPTARPPLSATADGGADVATRPPWRGRAGAGRGRVASPRFDAESLAAYVLGVSRGHLLLHPRLDPAAAEALRALVDRRAAREPLQHLLGTAVLGPVEVAVGPGVFTPRPETELLLEWGLTRAP